MSTPSLTRDVDRNRFAAVISLALLATTACSDSSKVTGTASVTSVTASAGNLQVGTVGTTLADSLVVLVTNASGAGVANVAVSWTPSTAGGTPSSTQVVTNADGMAKIAWTIGITPGTESMTAAVSGIHAIFTATATVGPPTQITVVNGSGLTEAPGSTLPALSARVRDQYGNPVPNVTVTWAVTAGGGSLASTTTGTNANGVATNTWTLGSVGGGTVNTVSATVTGSSGTLTPATFTAMAGVSLSTMSVGDVRVLRYDQMSDGLTIPASLPSAQYMIVASNNNLGSSVVPQITVSGSWQAPSSGVAAVGSRNAPVGGILTYTAVGGPRGAKFEARLRKLERSTLSPHTSSVHGPRASLNMQVPGPVKATLPAVGSKLQLKTLTVAAFDGSTPTCQAYVSTTGTVRAVSTHAIVVSDDSVPANGFTTTDYQSIASEFDSSIYPTDVSYFGTPTDHDNNGGHIIIYYTPSVNKQTPAGQAASNGYVGGFFFAGDLFSASGSGGSGCSASNEGEIFYLLAPDPGGQFGNTFSTDFVRQITRGTVAHEFQHMINAGTRYTENAAAFESSWLDEGLAHFAEEAVGRVEAGFGDLQTITVSNLQALDVDMQQAFFLQNFLRGDYYIQRPDTTGPIVSSNKAEQNLASRGASWLLLRYAADWFSGGNPRVLTRALATGPDTGTTNLVNRIGVPMDTLLAHWLVTLYTDHQNITNLDAKYNYKSYTMRSALASLSSSNHTPGEYLPVNALGDGNSIYTTGVPASSGVYFLTSLTTGGARSITFPSVGSLSTSGRFYIVRIQ